MHRTNDQSAITPATAQAFRFLTQLGLREPVIFGESVDVRACAGQGDKIHLQAIAALPEGQNPVASWLRLTQKLGDATRVGNTRKVGEVMPREVMLFNDCRFGVTIGTTHLQVQLCEKPLSVSEVLASQPIENQVAVHLVQGSLARSESANRVSQRMQLELA